MLEIMLLARASIFHNLLTYRDFIYSFKILVSVKAGTVFQSGSQAFGGVTLPHTFNNVTAPVDNTLID